ncbi:MAG: SLC13 family permease [Nitrospirota bacterium]|nr:SLC13 family permease [Nitrospirota bacterium]
MRNAVRTAGLLTGPLLFLLTLVLPEASGLSAAGQRTGGVALWMAVWWITEAVPLYVTGLLPLALFPLLHIVNGKGLASQYGHNLLFLFLGGFMLARAVERWNLHERIALRIVHAVGVSPRRLVLGMMVATAFLSLWISNTAATLIMLPIGTAILLEAAMAAGTRVEEHPELTKMATVMMLGITYAASVGGMGTLVGTVPNIVFAAQMSQLFPDAPDISFVAWMKVALPFVVVFVPLMWWLLTRWLFPLHLHELPGGREVIDARLRALPPLAGPERRVAVVFLLTALAWVFRADLDLDVVRIPGWASLLGLDGWVDDTTVAVVAALALFALPAGKHLPAGIAPTSTGALLDWDTARTIPWGLLILFGGGLALSKGVETSGLSVWIGDSLRVFSGLPLAVMLVVMCYLVTFLTEVMSNTALTTLLMPVLGALAVSLGYNPLLFMFAATLCASCAFMLPVATPPNAIVFGSGLVTAPQMARAGIWLNLLAPPLILAVVYLLALPVLGIEPGGVPEWAHGR